MRTSLFHSHGLNDVFRAAALLALWPRCFDASVERYASRIPPC